MLEVNIINNPDNRILVNENNVNSRNKIFLAGTKLTFFVEKKFIPSRVTTFNDFTYKPFDLQFVYNKNIGKSFTQDNLTISFFSIFSKFQFQYRT